MVTAKRVTTFNQIFSLEIHPRVACVTCLGVRKAFELGVRIVLIDSPDSWSKKLVDEKKAVKFIGAAWP